MSSIQFVSVIAIPITVLLVAVALIAFARPDPDDGPYQAYLALASLLSLYVLLLALGALGESIGQHLVIGEDPPQDLLGQTSSLDVYFSLFRTGGAPAIAAFATVAAVMGGAFAFHSRRRAELRATSASPTSSSARIDRAYRGAVCFAMISLAAVAALVAGAAGYNFFSQPIAGGAGDQMRDLAMGTLLSYGAVVLVAGLIFRSYFWAIRGNDETPDDELTVAELADP